MNELMSESAFKWFVTLLTGDMAALWLIYDSINLIRTRTADRGNPSVRDKHFGYVMGIAIALVGLVGCLRFHDVL